MSSPNDWWQRYQQQQKQRQQHAVQMIDYLMPLLRFLDLEKVVLHQVC